MKGKLNAAKVEEGFGIPALLYDWFAGWRFPVFMLSLLFFFPLFLFSMLLLPESEGPLGTFARDFRTWCFGVDPSTGEVRFVYGIMLILDPLLLAGVIYLFWNKPLHAVLRERPASLYRQILLGLVPVVLGAIVFIGMSAQNSVNAAVFPAERLRTSLPVPNIRLTDQKNQKIDVTDYRGKVVLITSFYASCGHTCPRILNQIRKVTEAIPAKEREDLTVLAITMDPERDSVKKLDNFSKLQKVEPPLYHLLTGEARPVNEILDKLGVTRKPIPGTGDFDHANIIFLVDRQGRIAYRLGLSDTQEKWLEEAALVLLREKGTVATATNGAK